MLRYEIWQYEECFWCFKCNGFALCEGFDAVLEPLFVTKGSFMRQAITEKHSEHYASLSSDATSFNVGAVTMQGWRADNEDAHAVSLVLPSSGLAFFGVFDGHGGPLVSRFVARHSLTVFDVLAKQCLSPGEATLSVSLAGVEPRHGVGAALTKTLLALDEQLQKDTSAEESGTTGTTVNIVVTNAGQKPPAEDKQWRKIWCANAGDARAVVCKGGGVAFELSKDHRLTDPAERRRVESSGGCVDDDRIDGMLAVSRAIGDFDFKQSALPAHMQPVTALPDITETVLEGSEEFIVVACDGVWDCMDSQTCVTFIRGQLAKNGGDPVAAAEALLDKCVAPEIATDGIGTDNMTVLVVRLDWPME